MVSFRPDTPGAKPAIVLIQIYRRAYITVHKLNMHRRFSNLEIRKISRPRPRSVDDLELGHFTLLFCRGRQRTVQTFITHVHSYCFAI